MSLFSRRVFLCLLDLLLIVAAISSGRQSVAASTPDIRSLELFALTFDWR